MNHITQAEHAGVPRLKRRLTMVCALIMVVCFPLAGWSGELLVGTGGPGTFSHFTGQTLCKLLSEQPKGLTCRAVPAENEVHILTNVRGGSLDLGLIDSERLYQAVRKRGPFQFLGIDYSVLRVIVPLYELPATLVVRRDAGIDSLQDLAGKRVNAGLPGSRQNKLFKALMQAMGWSKDAFALIEELPSGRSEERMALCHGTAQAAMHIGVHPDPGLQELFDRCPAGLLGLSGPGAETLLAARPAAFSMSLPAGAYPSCPETLETLGTKVLLAASADLDREAVAQILEALEAVKAGFRRAHPALSRFSLRLPDLGETGLRLHEAALPVYRGSPPN